MRSRPLLLAVLLAGMAGGTAVAQPYYPPPGYGPPGYAPPYAPPPPPPPGYYPPPPPPPGYYPPPGPGYGPPPRVPVGLHCDAPIESHWGRQQLICDIARPQPAGSRCLCPGPTGAPPVPGRVVR
ncbi:hypothetical protein [Roseomonas elaeocarpi]|uniref:Uncharacterized protein n=1 Tax=Roseomonas elaeocarpi TaxID=907779 RepID=A0ABV6JZ83_9PROT